MNIVCELLVRSNLIQSNMLDLLSLVTSVGLSHSIDKRVTNCITDSYQIQDRL